MNLMVDRKAAIKKLRTLVLSPKGEVEPFREKIEKTFSTPFIPARVEREEREYGGVSCDVLKPEIYTSRRVILYVHGGSFVAGSRDSWRSFCAQLANAASCRVVVPEFRLPPTHPFPAALDDLNTVFKMIYAEEEVAYKLENENDSSRGVELVVAADGSGASLAMALLFKQNEKYMSALRNLVLFSPWLDLSPDSEIFTERHVKDEVISAEDIHRAVDLYTYAANIANPLVSPLKAPVENFKFFPPVYIQMGQKEMLTVQVARLQSLLSKAGVECTVDAWENMMYMFQFADEYLSESHLAIERAGNYIRRRDGESESETEERERILLKNNIRREE